MTLVNYYRAEGVVEGVSLYKYCKKEAIYFSSRQYILNKNSNSTDPFELCDTNM